MSEIVTNSAVTFVNNKTPAKITTEEIDLNACFTDDEIVVEIHAAALNPVDFLLHSFAYSFILNGKPKVYSRDYSGVVIRAGKNVSKWKVGDKVTGMFDHVYGDRGALSNYLILNPDKNVAIARLAKFDDEKYDDFILNAAWPLVFGTAYSALLKQGQTLGPESKVLVIGASTSVSNAFIQIAKHHLHIGTVVGVSSKASMEHNKELGFDYMVPYNDGSAVEHVKDLIKNKLNNEKFDLIFDSVGNSDFYPLHDTFLKPKNEGSLYATIVGDSKFNYLNPSLWDILPNFHIFKRYGPFKCYNYSNFLLHPLSEYMELGVEMIEKGEYKPAIDSVYDFKDFQQALDRIRSNKAKGKVVIRLK